ncbi:MAG: glycosyltransferase family 2 protein [Calothrix sp. FI2-JRJ7]|jgi:glycosyltransferase involved in cell wall biosynthesis|nr:glycosyltransferase family 2 protein [Calothrix sp. FI2-JRJ7]
MAKESPLVSVIIPAYNAETFIKRTLDSILSQTYTNIEVLVVDDGSLDGTADILKSFVQKDSRVKLLQQSNRGVAAARNLAIEKSSGEYIAPIDADDIWYPQKLEKQVQCLLEADPSVGLVYAWSVNIDEDDIIYEIPDTEYHRDFYSAEGTVYPLLVYTNFIGCASVPLIRRSCFEKVGGYNCKLKAHNAQGCEDWDICLRIAEHYKFRVVQEFLIGYRRVRGSMSCNYRSMERSYNLLMADFQQRHPEIPTYIYDLSASNFCFYLSAASQSCGDYWSTLVLVYKSIKLDYTQIISLFKYQFLIKLLLKIAVKPIMSWMGLEHDYWYQYLKKKFKSPNNLGVNRVINVSDIQKKADERKPSRKRYSKIHQQRWLQVLQVCRAVEL